MNKSIQDVNGQTFKGIEAQQRATATTAQRVSDSVWKVQNLKGIAADFAIAKLYTTAPVYSACDLASKRLYIACRMSDKPLLNSATQIGRCSMLISGTDALQFVWLQRYSVKQFKTAGRLTSKQIAQAEQETSVIPSKRHACNAVNAQCFHAPRYDLATRQAIAAGTACLLRDRPVYVAIHESLNGETKVHTFNDSHKLRNIGFNSALVDSGAKLLIGGSVSDSSMDAQALLHQIVALGIEEELTTQRASYTEQRARSSKRLAYSFAKQRAQLEFAEQRTQAEQAAQQAARAEQAAGKQLENAKQSQASFERTSVQVARVQSELGKLAQALRDNSKGKQDAEQQDAQANLLQQVQDARLELAKLRNLQKSRTRNARHTRSIARVKAASSKLQRAQAERAQAVNQVTEVQRLQAIACYSARQAAEQEQSKCNVLATLEIARVKASAASAEIDEISKQRADLIAIGYDSNKLVNAIDFYQEQLKFYRAKLRYAEQQLRKLGRNKLAELDASAKQAKAEKLTKQSGAYNKFKTQSALHKVYELTRISIKNKVNRAKSEQDAAAARAEQDALKAKYQEAKKRNDLADITDQQAYAMLGVHASKSM